MFTTLSKNSPMYPSRIDRWVIWGLRILGVASCGLVALILLFLIADSIPALRQLGERFINDESWHPSEHAEEGTFGMLPIVVGSLTVTIGSILLAAPLGLASAIFSLYYAPPHGRVLLSTTRRVTRGHPIRSLRLLGSRCSCPAHLGTPETSGP